MNRRDQAADQHGVISRQQLLALGYTPSQAVQALRTRRWRRLSPGVYAAFTGPVDDRAQIWSALLGAGSGAVASHETALWLVGVLDERPPVVHVSIPATRRPRARAGVRLYRRRDITRIARPGNPPRTSVEAAVIDATAVSPDAARVLTLVFAATQRRFTTAARLRAELALRGRHRWRALMADVLADVEDGVASTLERRYKRDVERAHGLPRGTRNRPEESRHRVRYRDVRYRKWRLVVELDGRQAHPPGRRHLDLARDNDVVVDEDVDVLRYDWFAVTLDPCSVAGQAIAILRRNGWHGTPKRCPRCP